jgi:hypothetical protein
VSREVATYDRQVAVRHRGRDPDVIRITSAPQSPEQERGSRERRYVISMSIRTACFVAAVLVGGGWLRWVLVGAAFVLPYVAVVMANSASPRVEGTELFDPGAGPPELPGSTPNTGDDPPPSGTKRGTL